MPTRWSAARSFCRTGWASRRKFLVIATGEKVREAEAAGADFVGGEEMVERIQKENWTDYDALIATPDMMKSVGRLGKVLGPKGLMPNPKTGTVTIDCGKAVQEVKAGKVSSAPTRRPSSTCPLERFRSRPRSWSRTRPR